MGINSRPPNPREKGELFIENEKHIVLVLINVYYNMAILMLNVTCRKTVLTLSVRLLNRTGKNVFCSYQIYILVHVQCIKIYVRYQCSV